MALSLDRMTIEEAGPNPERLAAAIHRQLAAGTGPVPVAEIAAALGIVEIREKPLKSFDGALVMAPDRDVGMIIVNSQSSLRRRRCTLAHELGHFLNQWRQAENPGFACTKADIETPWRSLSPAADRRRRQEGEANRFAIELLAPARRMRPFVRGLPDLAKVLRLTDALLISREAGARRYVELHDERRGLVFSRDGEVRYAERGANFPLISYQRGDRLADLPAPSDSTGLSAHVEVDPKDWLTRPDRRAVVAQTLHQARGYAITLLALDGDPDEDEEED